MWAEAADVKLVWVDETRSEAYTSLHIPASTEAAAALAAAISIAQDAAPVCSTRVQSLTVAYNWRNYAPPDAVPGARINPRGTLIFSCGENQYFVAPIPGIKGAIQLLDPYNANIFLDTSYPEMAAYIAVIMGGPWCNPFGYDIVSCEAAYLQVRNNAKTYFP